MPQFTIDPEFRDKIPPLTPDEFSKLEQNILEDGEVLEPLVVWKERNILLDGHHRWKIIQKHPELQDKYRVKEMNFPDKWAAIVWICRKQLGRRNITDEIKTVLVGVAYKAQKMAQGNHAQRGTDGKFLSSQNGNLGHERTAQVVADNFKVGKNTVIRAEHFVDGLNAAEKVSPGIKEAVLSGEVKAPKTMIAEIRNIPEKQQKEAANAIMRKDIEAAKQIIRPTPEKKAPADTPEFTVDDLSELLYETIKTLDNSLKLHLVLTHKDMLKTAEARTATRKALDQGKKVLEHYGKIVMEVEKNGTQN